MERLPIGPPTLSSSVEFFPDTPEEAAPEVAKALIHAFVNCFGGQVPQAIVPWNLTTEDKNLAAAVGAEFKKLGVAYEALHRVGVSTKGVNDRTQEVFHRLFTALKKATGFEDHIAIFISTPTSIIFLPPPAQSPRRDQEGDFELALKYVQELQRCRPPVEHDISDPKEHVEKLTLEMDIIQRLIKEKPEHIVKSEADNGNPDSALDYGLRLQFGFGAPRNRAQSRKYFFKALLSPSASDILKSTIHSLLIIWHMDSSDTKLRLRHLYAAAHHANLSTSLCRSLLPSPSPSALPASPAALFFMKTTLEPHSKNAPEVCLFWKVCWKAWEDRKRQVEGEMGKMDEKRMRRPNRYRCAAVGCEIEADKGQMLLQCSGKCDSDKKPSYCGKECQRADWKNHKPFCRPGAACSVIDTGTFSHGTTKPNALQIPITVPGGKTVLVSSSTMDAKELKELKGGAEGMSGGGQTSMSMVNSLTVEMVKLDGGDEEEEEKETEID